MSLRLRLWLAVVTWVALTCPGKAAEVYSANVTLEPAYGVAGCAIVYDIYAGTDRQLFIAPQDAYYRVKDYSEDYQPYWFITVEAFDPNTPLFNQALAVSNTWSYGAPRQVWLSAGSRVYIWSGWTGGYGSLSACQNSSYSKTVTMRIVGEDSGIPAPPTSLSGSASAVSFTPGANNGSQITNYEYALYDEEEEEYVFVALSPAQASSPITLPNLPQGAEVTLRLRAVNANGSSTESAELTFTPYPAVPAAPAVTRTDYGDGKIYLYVSLSDDGGSAVTEYTATCDDGSTTYIGTAQGSTITVTGLTNDVAYTCTVTATNSAGTSAASTPTDPITPEASAAGLPIWLLYQATQ